MWTQSFELGFVCILGLLTFLIVISEYPLCYYRSTHRCSTEAISLFSLHLPLTLNITLHFGIVHVSLSTIFCLGIHRPNKSRRYNYRAISLTMRCSGQTKNYCVIFWMRLLPCSYKVKHKHLKLLMEKSDAKWLPSAKEWITDILDTKSAVLSVEFIAKPV